MLENFKTAAHYTFHSVKGVLIGVAIGAVAMVAAFLARGVLMP